MKIDYCNVKLLLMNKKKDNGSRNKIAMMMMIFLIKQKNQYQRKRSRRQKLNQVMIHRLKLNRNEKIIGSHCLPMMSGNIDYPTSLFMSGVNGLGQLQFLQGLNGWIMLLNLQIGLNGNHIPQISTTQFLRLMVKIN